MELFETKYFRGQGKLFIGARDAAGEPSGLTFVGDLSSATLTPNVGRSEIIENVTGASAVGASALKSVKFSVAIAMRSIKPEHLAIALSASNVAKAGSSVVDEAHTCYLDKFTRLEHNKISAVTITGAGGTPTYVADTDYIVHADEGMIEFISGGTITDALPVLIDYTYASQHHVKSDPGNLERYIVFAGMNTANNDKQTRCEMYKVKLDPGVFALITDDPTDATINGTLELDTLRAAGDQTFSWKLED